MINQRTMMGLIQINRRLKSIQMKMMKWSLSTQKMMFGFLRQ